MNQKIIKTLALLLSTLIIISGLELTSFAEYIDDNITVSLEDTNSKQELPQIEEEIVSKRTAYSKVFSTEDDGFYTIVSSTPIHFEDENGDFQNLVEPTSELSTEEIISDYVTSEAELFINEYSSISPLSNITEDDQYNDYTNLTVKCFGPSSVYTGGNFVQGSSKGNRTVCIKPIIDQDNILVTSAKITANAIGLGTTTNNYVVARKITSNWDDNTTTKPTINSNYFDCVSVSKSTISTAVEWDITHLMNSWMIGIENNNGFALVAKKSGCSVSLSNISMSFYYHEIDELDDDFTYETIDMGIAGNVYINHFSCVPELQRNDLGIDGEKSPVSISHTYNPFYVPSINSYGNNFRLNYESILTYMGNFYTWKTIEGDTIDFKLESTNGNTKTYTSTDLNSTFTLLLKKGNQENQFKYTTYENIVIQNNQTSEKYYFESHANIGYLNLIDDGSENHNEIHIGYDFTDDQTEQVYTSNSITYITDGVGRKYVFNYDTENNTSYLTSIDVVNSDNTPIRVGNSNDAEVYKITYLYETINGQLYLTCCTHVGGNSAVYTYDSNDRLSTISDGVKMLTLTYADETTNKIASYSITKSYNDSEVLIEQVTIDSSKVYERIFTNINNETCILNYDENYNTVYYKGFDGTIINGITQNGETSYFLIPDNNLITNGDFELLDDDEYPSNWIIENEDADIIVDDNEINDNTLQINSSLFDTARIYQQINAPDGVSFKANESYVYGGIAKADNAIAPNSEHTFGVYIFNAVEDGDDLVPNECISYFNFDHTLHNIQQQKMSYFTLEEDTPALFVYICFDYNYDGESAFFDDIQLSRYNLDFTNIEKPSYVSEKNQNNSVTSEKIISKIPGNLDYIGSFFNYDSKSNMNYLSSIEDEYGIITYYTYNPENGRLMSSQVGTCENAKNFEYTALGLLSSVSQTVNGLQAEETVVMRTDYGYTDGMLTSVTHNGFSYNFEYDAYGNVTNVSVISQDTSTETQSETSLIQKTYTNSQKALVDTITYANNDTIKYYYDEDKPDLITRIEFNHVDSNEDDSYSKVLSYNYDENGELTSIIDEKANVKLEYGNNSFSYIILDNNSERTLYSSTVNELGNIVETFPQLDGTCTSITTISRHISTDTYATISSSSQVLNRVDTTDSDTSVVTYSYDKSNLVDEFDRQLSNSVLAKYQVDSEITIINSEDEYTYNSSDNKQTSLINTYRTKKSLGSVSDNGDVLRDETGNVVDEAFIDLTYSYTYDSAGNITQILLTDNITSETLPYGIYKYDTAGQLVFDYSYAKDFFVTYSYDEGGNITKKEIYDLDAYDYDNDVIYPDAECDSYQFTYDSTYKDRLISISNTNTDADDNQTTYHAAITYDDLGNPLNYDVANGVFEWNGHLLSAFETNGTGNRYEYEYDENGFRIRKKIFDKRIDSDSNNGYSYTLTSTIEYVWENGVLKGLSFTNSNNNTSAFMNIIYDESGAAQGYIGLTGTPYYFIRDALGNVTSVINGVADIKVDFAYDAWGNPTMTSHTDDIGAGLASIFISYFNPSTYKGYLYDYETGLYYCQSRYYSSVWSRFINMDDPMVLTLTQGDTLGANLYAYCNNNPVNYTDTSGFLAQHWYNKVSNVAKIIDIAILLISAGRSIVGIKAMRTFLKDNQRKIVKNVTKELLKYIGSISSVVISTAVEVSLTLIGSSVGDLIAKALDYIDPWWKKGYSRNNGYIFN